MLKIRGRKKFAVIFILAAALHAQVPSSADSDSPASSPSGTDTETGPERWNLYYQSTSIGDYHGKFKSPYEDATSLQDYPERDVSLTTTLFFTWRLEQDTFLVFDPEIAGGKGFSGVNGIANQPNGEIPRVATATPKPYHRAAVHSARFRIRLGQGTSGERRKPARGRSTCEPLFDLCRPIHRHRLFRQQQLHARSAHAVHGLGRDVQRRLGLSGRHARLHLGDRAGSQHAELVLPLWNCRRTESRQRPAVRPAPFPRSRSGLGSGTALRLARFERVRFALLATTIASRAGTTARPSPLRHKREPRPTSTLRTVSAR